MASSSWKPSGLVALTTDFGLVDPYVGLMKAVIGSRAPAVRIVDLTHGVPAQDVRVAGFFLERAVAYFPPGTVHVGVVDPGVGSARRALVAEAHGQCFIGPDNGIFTRVLGEDARVRELDVARFALPDAARTFHGRDVFAPAAAAIAAGLAPFEAGIRDLPDWVRLAPRPVERSEDGRRVVAVVLFVDHYGNVVLDLSSTSLAGPLEAWSARIEDQRLAFARTYAHARPGEGLLLVDSFGALEVAVRDGDAAARFGLARGTRVMLERRS